MRALGRIFVPNQNPFEHHGENLSQNYADWRNFEIGSKIKTL